MSNSTDRFDIAVLGGGPGGYVAAIRAAQLGAKVCVIEKDTLGGTCLNRGCIPTKTWVANAEHLSKIKKAANYGINVSGLSIDWNAMLERKNTVVKQLSQGVGMLLKKHKIAHITGAGYLVSNNEIKVATCCDTIAVNADNIILATGSEPANIPVFNIDGKDIMTSTEILNIEQLPKSMLVIGGGYIGCEFASIFNEFGVEVTIVDVMPTLLGISSIDEQIIRQLQAIFKKTGIKIVTKAKIKEVRKSPDGGVVAELEEGEPLTAEKALVSIGRKFNTDNIGLEEIGVEKGKRGEVIVNESTFQTNIPNIYAIGDINAKMQLAHVASHQGIIAVESILKKQHLRTLNYNNVPSCVFTLPPIGNVGLSEKKAVELGYEVITGRFSYIASGKALAEGEKEGTAKVVIDKKTNLILGGHIIGPGATEMIHEFAIAMENELTAQELYHTIHSHPTLSEIVAEATENAYGLSIHN